MITGRYKPAVVAAGGKLYALGGYTRKYEYGHEFRSLNGVEAYDPATRTWLARASMKDARADFVAVEAGGFVGMPSVATICPMQRLSGTIRRPISGSTARRCR